jgi:hypothetical protein
MFCRLFRLTISHSCDTGRPLWSLTKKHLNTCNHCREFNNFCLSLADKLPAEVKRLSFESTALLHQRIQHDIAEISPCVNYTNFRVWPVAAAAALIMIISLSGIYVFTNHREKPMPDHQVNPSTASVINNLEGLFASGIEWTKANQSLENPVKTELLSLTTNTMSAASFLFACVDAKIAYTNNIEEQK